MVFGVGSITYTSAPSTVTLNRKLGYSDSTSSPQTTTLLDIARTSIPPIHLNPLLFNGHLQTAWTAFGGEDVPIHYRRRIFQSTYEKYPGQFAVDWVVPAPPTPLAPEEGLPPRTHTFDEEEWARVEASEGDKPLLFVLHGLSGGSDEAYLRHMLKPVTEAGFEACVINARGCAKSKITSKVLYNARATWDIRQLVQWARKTWPERRMFAVGFSLGANILTNFVGEEGETCELEAAISVCNPWSLEVCNAFLNSTWIGLNVYSASMGKGMRDLVERHLDEVMANTEIDIEKMRASKYLYEWDRYVQCPSWGYPTEGAYYRDASSTDSVLNIRIPFLAIHATDDPIVYDGAVPYGEIRQNPYTVICATSNGGHLAYFEWWGGRWYSRAVSAFLKKFVDETDGMTKKKKPEMDSTPAAASAVVDIDKPVYEPLRRRLWFRQ